MNVELYPYLPFLTFTYSNNFKIVGYWQISDACHSLINLLIFIHK